MTMKKAASEFEVPLGTTFLLVFSDIFDRDVLSKHKNFCFEYTSKKIGHGPLRDTRKESLLYLQLVAVLLQLVVVIQEKLSGTVPT